MAVVCIAGAGGIGRAVAVLLRHMYGEPVDILIGDINNSARRKAVEWIANAGSAKNSIAKNAKKTFISFYTTTLSITSFHIFKLLYLGFVRNS